MQPQKPSSTLEIQEHLSHVQYPVTGRQLMTACNNMSDVPANEREWVKQNLSEDKTYNSPADIKADLG
ncbi:MAG: hypothetical protein GX799_03395, partial [Crenarchaeota archaeon]|nr:hypothetical protein [Thermoproteota archaeon]